MFQSTPLIRSLDGFILRLMREEKKLSLPNVAKMTGFKAAAIDHMENGKKIITEEDIKLFLNCYQFSLEVFNDLKAIKNLNKQSANLYFIKRTRTSL